MDKLDLNQNSLETIMSDRFGRYSKYIIQERALPDVRDGLKPVQRRILYAMYSDGNTTEKPYRKSAKTVGLVIGNFHPHGDSSVYEAMVRLSQSWKMNLPLVDMQGNNGSIDDDPAAAMRYTEARLTAFGQALLIDIDQDTVNFTSNFDDTTLEPSVLPALVPELLVNGTSGIAAGYATNIPPHNLREVVEASMYRLNHPEASIKEIAGIILGPDFPTGGIVQGRKGIMDAFETGKGRVVIRVKAEIVQVKNIQQIVITEIPFEVIKSNLVKKMDDIRISKSIDGILEVRDESDRTGLRIVLDLRKESDAQMILNYLYKNTDCQIYFNYNMVSIIKQRPVLSGILTILDSFIDFRKEVVLRRSQYQLTEIQKRMHVLEGLIKAISVLDEVIMIIRSSKDKSDAKGNLMVRFNFTEVQAEAIVSLRLYRLTNTDILELKNELAELSVEWQRLQGIIENERLLRNVILKEFQELLKRFDTPRRSKVEAEVEEIVIDKMSMITNDKTVVTVSRDGYIKRVSIRSYQSSEGVLPALKDKDALIGVIDAETYDHLLLFNDVGTYAIIPLHTLEESKWKDLGNHYGHYVKADDHTKLVAAHLIKSFDTDAFMVTVSQNGNIKRSRIKDFLVSRISKTFDAMILSNTDKVVASFVVYPDEEVILVSQEGYCVRYQIDMIPTSQPKAKGVKAMNLQANDKIAYACALANQNNLVFVCESGLMKRIKTNEIATFNRPAKGELIAKKIKSNPQRLVYVQAVQVYDDIRITHDNKRWIPAKDISLMDKSQTFSQVADEKDFYIVKRIEEVRIVEFKSVEKEPQSKEEHSVEHHDVEFIHFDLD